MTDRWIVSVVAGLFGLLIGSFLNVCIVRLPADQSVVRPGSRCPKCGTAIRWWDNVPVFSWILLRGKCRDCGVPISILYPVVELATGLLFFGAVFYYGLGLEAARAAGSRHDPPRDRPHRCADLPDSRRIYARWSRASG